MSLHRSANAWLCSTFRRRQSLETSPISPASLTPASFPSQSHPAVSALLQLGKYGIGSQRCALAACPNSGRSLVPLQAAFGVLGGSQIVRHPLCAGMSADPCCLTFQVDWKNALNTLLRDQILAAVAQCCPALLPMAAWAYGRHSHLIVHQTPRTVISSKCGVWQGNRLGLLLFPLTLQGPLEEVAAMGLARPLAFADDTFLQVALAPTMQAFGELASLAIPLGLHSQPAKCAVHSGDPVGTPAFQTTYADSCATRVCHLMDEFLALHFRDQDRWLVLHGSLQKLITNLPGAARGSA
jgi:hypothetical protein